MYIHTLKSHFFDYFEAPELFFGGIFLNFVFSILFPHGLATFSQNFRGYLFILSDIGLLDLARDPKKLIS